MASVRVSNVDKHGVEGERPVRLCNYTDVYYRERITSDLDFMTATASEAQISKFRLRPGDVIITKDSETPDDIAVPAFVDADLDDLVCGYHLAIIRPYKVDPRFLFWAMSANPLRSRFSSEATGVTRFGLRTESIANAPLLTPSLSQQRRIADFLDAETGRIDALIEKKLRMIALLQDRRTRLIESEIAPQADLGRLVTGDCSSHSMPWPIVALKRTLRGAIPGGTPDTDDPLLWGSAEDTSATPWVAIGDMVDRSVTTFTAKAVTEDGIQEARLRTGEPGTLLLAMYASLGKLTVIERPMVWNQAILGLVPRPDVLVTQFLAYWLEIIRPHFTGLARSNTQDNLNAEQVGALPVLLPPAARQGRIVQRLDAALLTQSRIQNQLLSQINLLAEHRQALITAAVTGELDLAEAA